jgi:hypothetical protein
MSGPGTVCDLCDGAGCVLCEPAAGVCQPRATDLHYGPRVPKSAQDPSRGDRAQPPAAAPSGGTALGHGGRAVSELPATYAPDRSANAAAGRAANLGV